MSSFLRAGATAGVVTALTAGTVLALAGPAAAHVTVNPDDAVQGEYAKLTFRVPNESETAGTVRVRVAFPTDAPFASVRVKPHDGWTPTVRKARLRKPVKVGDLELDEAVTSITWTARKGVRIGRDEFDEFDVSVGPLPAREAVAFPAVQTYDDGEVVRWDDPVRKGREEPEYPAPTLTITPAGAKDTAPAVRQNTTPSRASVDAGLVVGVAGLAVAVVALLAARRRSPT